MPDIIIIFGSIAGFCSTLFGVADQKNLYTSNVWASGRSVSYGGTRDGNTFLVDSPSRVFAEGAVPVLRASGVWRPTDGTVVQFRYSSAGRSRLIFDIFPALSDRVKFMRTSVQIIFRILSERL